MSKTDAAAPRHTEEQLVGIGIDHEAHWHQRYVELKREHEATEACLMDAIAYALRPNCCGDALRDKVNRWRAAVRLPPLPDANNALCVKDEHETTQNRLKKASKNGRNGVDAMRRKMMEDAK